ncbi:hypothetical protein [uncultured Brachyspira sp.]|uniref:hypothetical protein n=1 Tax=uncultured Brachyspira sp. TaxID=221953 RepID=UPI0027DDF1B7|nr:hypothetical protein [uncultured Brachyspira sp.]
MKNSKKLFLIFLSVLIVAFVSCKKDSGGSITTPTPTFKLSSLEGTWEEIRTDGQTVNFNIDSWDNTKEVTQLTTTHKNTSGSTGDTDFTFIFENANSCKVEVKGSKGTTSKNFTKQATATAK